MSRTYGRLGLYYLVLRGEEGRMFYGSEDYRAFLSVLDEVLAATRYRLHAYCLLRTRVHLAVQMGEASLPDFVQRLTIKFGHWMRQRHGELGGMAEQVGSPRLVDNDAKLRELIRFIHLQPLKSRLDLQEYAWSGHRTYLGLAEVSCLEARTGLRLFAKDLPEARERYAEYVREGAATVQSGRADRSRPAAEAGTDSLEGLILRIAQLGGRTVADIRSTSRERLTALLRAVFAWHATRLEIATFGEIFRYLRRNPSSLYALIDRYSAIYPALFNEPGKLEGLAEVRKAGVNGRPPLNT